MKILHVYKTAYPFSYGGVENFIHNLCHETEKSECSNTVFALKDEKKTEIKSKLNYTLVSSKQDFKFASTGFSFKAFKIFSYLVQKNDLIHFHFPDPFSNILHLSILKKKPYIITYHSDIVKQKHLLHLYKPLMNKFLKKSKAIIATSENYVNSSSVLKNFKPKVIPIGIPEKFSENVCEPRKHFYSEKLPEKFFLFVGVLRYYKGLDFLVEAMKDLKAFLVIAGDGPVLSQLKEMALKLNLKNIIFLGKVSEKDKKVLLDLCFAFVFPSNKRSEAYGISLLEACAFGKPLISCEIDTGTSFINVHNKTGLVVKPSSSISLRNAMTYFLKNECAVELFSKNSKKRFNENFHLSKMVKAYLDIYNTVLN